MKKILMTLMGLEIGGAETHVVELADELARRGWDVTLASNGGVYEQGLAASGIKHVKVPLHNKNPLNMMRSYRSLKRLIKKENFDIIHAHARIPAFICGILAKRLKFKFITSAHWVFKANFPWNIMTNWGNRTVAVSQDIKQYLIDNYAYPARKIDITINGIDTDKFSKNADCEELFEEFALDKNKKRIVYVSRMDTDRSAVAFMLVDAMLAMKRSDIQAFIVGGGDDLERLKTKVKAANEVLGENGIIVAGGRTDINKCVAAGDIFVGVSRAALEAMAAEKPTIIAGNEGYIGIIEESTFDLAFETNFCCRGCEPSSSGLLVRDLERLLADSSGMGEYNRNLILEHYSVRAMTDVYEKAYAKINAKNVMISGYYGYKNMGDDCLLSAILDALEDADVTVLSRTPDETRLEYGVRSIWRFNAWKIMKQMKQGGVLINGGGSILQDVTSTKSILYYLQVIKMARFFRMKVMVYANGIGPVSAKANRRRVKKVLNQVDIITLREQQSLEELRAMGVANKNVEVTADPAFALEPCSEKRIDELLKDSEIKGEFFAIAVRPWKDDIGAVAEIARKAQKKHGLTPLFIVMQPQKDAAITESLRKKATHGKVLQNAKNAADIIGVLGRAQFLIGMRLHAVIYAARMGTPFIGLSYDPKIDAIAEALGSNVFLHKVSDINPQAVLKDIEHIMKRREKISSELSQKAAEMREKTKRDAELVKGLLA